MILDYFKLTFRALLEKKMRSYLTILGIVIGIAAIVGLYSLGEGMENALNSQFSRLGADVVLIAPKGLRGPPIGAEGLATKDSDVVKSIPELEDSYPLILQNTQVEFNDEVKTILIRAFPQENAVQEFEKFGREIYKGQDLSNAGKFSVVIGYALAKDGFSKEIRVNNKLKINGQNVRVIGIAAEQGEQTQDNWIMMPFEGAKEAMKTGEKINVIAAFAKQGTDFSALKEKIKRKLEKSRDDEDILVMTPDEISKQISNILGVVRAVLLGIAAISILVGAIGITNAMYTSVLERTREIGIMKAIGARNSSILMMYLIESAFIGFVGGLIGVICGFSLSLGIQEIARISGFTLLKINFNMNLILFSMLFSLVIGILSGTLPAYRASKLNPVDALRYE